MKAFALNSCQETYPEGPKYSFTEPKKRIAREWKLESYYRNGLEETSTFTVSHNNYLETYTEDGSWTYSYTNENGTVVSGAGTWGFNNSEESRIDRRSGPYLNSIEEVHILRLTKKEYWYWTIDYTGTKYEYHLKHD